jgi:hypothetical protein
MIAIKKSYDYNESKVLMEKTYGSLVGLEWVNPVGNTFRVFTTNPINAGINRKFVVDVFKQIKPIGEDSFIPYSSYQLIADDTTYRLSSTGAKVESTEALDENGIIKMGYDTNAQFFINTIGYNKNNIIMSLYDYIYKSLAEKEEVTI